MELNRIYNCDCLSGLKDIENEFVDMVITSPPYDNLRKYDGYVFTEEYFLEVINELFRVLKKGGVIIWVVNDQTKKYTESGTSFKQALKFKDVGFCIYDTMIFAKKNSPPLTQRRYEQSFEYMFVFSKGKVKTFNPIKVKCENAGKERGGTRRQDTEADLKEIHTKGKVNEEKIKGNIWEYSVGAAATEDKIAFNHEAIFPEKLAEDHIISWSNKGDIVLDIFMGSGTVAKVALKNERNFIGFEISKKKCEEANERISNLNTDINK
ncbi:DNA methyltransferase [Clostridium botulinum]|uniref:DNA methyltransferase n=1 Tax=Clostridium botulinum TaxID=1491 RepID=UPI001967FD17